MIRLRTFLRSQSGAAAAEFAMVLPVALLVLLVIIDIGRYFWTMNEMEKAVQAGTRYAVATEVVPAGLNEADYTTVTCPGGGAVNPGDTICREALGTVTCRAV
jgi:Flp pilus assembly protein TadG